MEIDKYAEALELANAVLEPEMEASYWDNSLFNDFRKVSQALISLHAELEKEKNKPAWCWLFHRYGKWTTESGHHPLFIYIRRDCSACGKIKRRLI